MYSVKRFFKLSFDHSGTFLTNLSEFPTGCRFFQFPILVNMLYMLHYVCARCLIQITQLLLSKPNCLVFKFNINASVTILALVYYN